MKHRYPIPHVNSPYQQEAIHDLCDAVLHWSSHVTYDGKSISPECWALVYAELARRITFGIRSTTTDLTPLVSIAAVACQIAGHAKDLVIATERLHNTTPENSGRA